MIRTISFPPHCNRGEILAHAFGTCHSRANPRDTKAMARAKPTRKYDQIKHILTIFKSLLLFNIEMAKKAKTEVEEPLEKKLWKAADKLRKNMDAAEYKHVALGRQLHQ